MVNNDFDFLRDYVTGDLLTTQINSINNIIYRFNSLLIGKIFIYINETALVDFKREYKAQFTKLKQTTINIKNKRKNIIVQNNYINYCVCFNNDYTVDIEERDWKYIVFKCNDKYKNNKEYFDRLVLCFTTKVGNTFYTFLRSKEIKEFLVNLNDISMTVTKQTVLENIKSKVVLFTEKLFIEKIEYIQILILIRFFMS